ncbi:MAG: HIT family protein [Acidimicrobiales bacterium]
MDYLTAGWRMGHPKGEGADGRPHVDVAPAPGQSLFEAIETSGRPDNETYILDRLDHTFAILNVFPYTAGHLMVLPRRAVPSIEELDEATFAELWRLVRHGLGAINRAFSPEGINIGINQGVAGGGSEPDHLHVHVVPRWSADTNFMTSVADTRILPVTLERTWEQLRASW